jgi:1-acyl-sn-glycerol-3-phosphate acyltransferase
MAAPAGDPVRLRSARLFRFFAGIMARAMGRSFHAVRVAAPGPPALPPDRPAIVYLNHPSWWDPAFIILLAHRCFGARPSFGPIDGAQLGRYRFMARIGVFGVAPGPRGAAAFLRAAQSIFRLPGAMMWITPEGRFTDVRERPVRLRPGLAHLVRRVPDAMILPLAVEYPFWDERTPEALARFGTAVPAAELAGLPPAAITERLSAMLAQAMDALAADAASRDPARFVTLVAGRVGVGGIYDLWRRLTAALRGERFHAGHGAPEP